MKCAHCVPHFSPNLEGEDSNALRQGIRLCICHHRYSNDSGNGGGTAAMQVTMPCENPNNYFLKILTSGHSSATWCYMMNASMWSLPTSVQKEWCVGFHYRNDKESHTFQWRKPFILQQNVDTDVSLTYLSNFAINQHSFVVLINYKKMLGAFQRNL